MALNECERCTTAFAVGLERCPHCQSTEYHEQGATMPKISKEAGPSYGEDTAPNSRPEHDPSARAELLAAEAGVRAPTMAERDPAYAEHRAEVAQQDLRARADDGDQAARDRLDQTDDHDRSGRLSAQPSGANAAGSQDRVGGEGTDVVAEADYRAAVRRRDRGDASPDDVALITRYEQQHDSTTSDRYEAMTADELKDELRKRKDADGKSLKVSGSQDDLKARLREHDRTQV